MAAKYSQEIPELEPESLDTVEISVRTTFNSLIQQLIEKRDQLIEQICKIRNDYNLKETERTEYLESLEKQIREMKEKNANRPFSKVDEETIKYWTAKKEEYEHPNPIPTPPQLNTSHLDELRDQIERFGALDYSAETYTSKLCYIRSIGKEGKGEGELHYPYGVVLGESGNIFIADMGNSRIQLFSWEGQFIREIGKRELDRPYSIGLYNDWLFVTDYSLNKVLKYATQNYKLECKSELELNYPYGITVGSNEVFVADCMNNRIVVLSLDLKFIRVLGNKKLVKPRDVTVKNNKVFVADSSEHHNVHVFSKLGDLLNSIINLRDGTDSIFVCLDKFNNILISDWSGKIIQIYTLEGLLIHSIECDYNPTGIAVTHDNIIICADFSNGKLNFY